MKRTRMSLVAAGAALALATTALAVAPATGSGDIGASAVGKRPTELKVRTSADKVVVLEPAFLSGTVSGPKRKVVLQLRNAYGWRTVDKDKSDGEGTYELKAPTKWYGAKELRVVVPPTRKYEDKTRALTIKVDEGYPPLGSKRSWTRIVENKWIRYNPCQAIKYAVNPDKLPQDGIAVLNEAIFRIEKASGLRYKYVGKTKAIPFRTTKGKRWDREANLSVAWSTPRSDAKSLGGPVLARGGFSQTQYIRHRDTFKLIKTGLLLDAGFTYEDRAFVNGAGLGAVHMHELVHAAGLGHTDDPTQIMNPVVSPHRPALYGKGDIAGLRKHGLDAGCLSRGGHARVVPGVARQSLPEVSLPFVRGVQH